jgi:hypothetical protein
MVTCLQLRAKIRSGQERQMNTLKFASIVICLLVVGSATAADAPGARLPEGDRGIAAKYRSDKDIY